MCVHFVEKDLQALALIEDMKGAIQDIGEPNKILICSNSSKSIEIDSLVEIFGPCKCQKKYENVNHLSSSTKTYHIYS